MSRPKGTREATHANSWYDGNPGTLSGQLDGWLADVPSTINGSEVPIPNARVVIAP